ncbi:ABC transporter permease [Clostridium oceanicum]|uniref:ABC-2 family transporter protein n=1 Tax=Clostridium oceanicum TaxID=1543 RepID=A0ABN1JG41_9CLOT
MIKSELIKFFTPFKMIIYGGIILTFILIADVIFKDSGVLNQTLYSFIFDNVKTFIFVIPIILAPIASEIFTHDYECGCMKFFVLYKKREKVLFSKMLSLFLITTVLIIFTFFLLTLTYMFLNWSTFNISLENILKVSRMGGTFLITLIPILLIFVMISILFKNSSILSLLVFLLVIMSDFFPKVIGNITPRRFLWEFVLQEGQITKFSIILFVLYIIFFMILDIKLFSKKEMIL